MKMSNLEEGMTNVSQQKESYGTAGKDQPAEDDATLVDNSFWMIRPCSVYDAEKWECVKPRARFYQYYIEGEMADCSKWVSLMKDCRLWKKNDDIAAGARIIRHEKELVERRIESRLQNDIWTRREERPPPNWNDPLPPHIAEVQKDSILADYEDEMTKFSAQKNASWCTIS